MNFYKEGSGYFWLENYTLVLVPEDKILGQFWEKKKVAYLIPCSWESLGVRCEGESRMNEGFENEVDVHEDGDGQKEKGPRKGEKT